jgi:hypothetical protein
MASPRALADVGRLKERHSDAQTVEYDSGNISVALELPLPEGWSASKVLLRFIVPNGYPTAPPDCFWVEPNLKVKDAQPRASQYDHPMPDTNVKAHWFSWHINDQSQWNGNNDNVFTWLNACRKRFNNIE